MLALSFLAPVPALAARSCRSCCWPPTSCRSCAGGGYVVRFTTMDLLDSVAPKRPRWRRHLPAIGLLLGLVALVAVAGQAGRGQRWPTSGRVVVLAIDTSLSMEATDVAPSRLAAAQDAARTFLENVPNGVRVGLVGFDNGARLLVPPTDKMAVVERADRPPAARRGHRDRRGRLHVARRHRRGADQSRRAGDQTARAESATGPRRRRRSPASRRPWSCCCPTARTPSGARTTRPRPRPRRRAGPCTRSPWAPTAARSQLPDGTSAAGAGQPPRPGATWPADRRPVLHRLQLGRAAPGLQGPRPDADRGAGAEGRQRLVRRRRHGLPGPRRPRLARSGSPACRRLSLGGCAASLESFDGLRPAHRLADRPAEPDRSAAGAPAEPLPPHPPRHRPAAAAAAFMADLGVLGAVVGHERSKGVRRGAR